MSLIKGLKPLQHCAIFWKSLLQAWFTCLFIVMKHTPAVVTLRTNRSRDANLPLKNQSAKSKFGSIYWIKSRVFWSAWYDNCSALNISNFVGRGQANIGSLYDTKNDETIKVSRPAGVEIYSKFIAGVDKMGILSSL